MAKHLIFNADDFGASSGVNRGILEAHLRGVVTSTSLTVTGHALDDAVAIGRDMPDLAVGLHWDVWGEDERQFNTRDLGAVRAEFDRQLAEFQRTLGRMPTHIDSHRHAHLEPHLVEFFRELVSPLGVPLRGDGQVRFVGGFYAQWEWMVTNLEYVSVTYLERMLVEEVHEGWTEFSCHPGHVSPDYQAVYLQEREAELATLTDPTIRQALHDQCIRLVSYADWQAENEGQAE